MRASRIATFLPQIYQAANQDRTPLRALLEAMETLHARPERVLDQLDDYVDPARAPADFLPMLAGWLDLAPYLDWSGGRAGAGELRFAPGAERLRLLIAEVPRLRAQAGSRRTLEAFLAVATGCQGFRIEESPADDTGAPRAFHVRVAGPAEARRYADLVERIVEGERPAYVTYEIVYDDPVVAKDGTVEGG